MRTRTQREISAIFRLLDTDTDGEISVFDIFILVPFLSRSVTDESLRFYVDFMRRNNRLRLTETDVNVFMEASAALNDSNRDRDDVILESQVSQVVDEIVLSYDDSTVPDILHMEGILSGRIITKSHIRSYFRKVGIPVTKSYIRDIFDLIDTNRDSVISYEEYLQFLNRREKELYLWFHEFDRSRTGELSMEELVRGLSSVGIHLKPQDRNRIEGILARDGSISFQTFRNFFLFSYLYSMDKINNSWMQSTALSPEDCHQSPAILLAGFIAGIVSRTATAPLDRLKLIYQSRPPELHKSFLKSVKELYHNEGWKSFYRGNGTNCIKIAPETAIKFWSYERMKILLHVSSDSLSLSHRFISGSLAGIISQLAIYPLEIAKTRLALSPPRYYRGIADCLLTIYRREGMHAIYRGLNASLIGIIPYSGVDLGIFSLLKDKYTVLYDRPPGVLALLGIGAVSSGCAQLVSYPFSLSRTRLQIQGMQGEAPQYRGLFDCLYKTVKQSGLRGLYRGILVNFGKAVPAISINYAVYETIKQSLSERR